MEQVHTPSSSDLQGPITHPHVSTPADADGHRPVVQFYEDERFLSSAVADFLAAGLTLRLPLA